jgi:hypothetical protein
MVSLPPSPTMTSGSPAGHGYLFGFGGNDSLDGNYGGYSLDGADGFDLGTNGVAYLNCENQPDGVVSPPPATEPTGDLAPPTG